MSSDAIRQRKRERTKRLVFGTHTYIIIHTYIDHSTRILHANTRKIMNADEKKVL
jgi:hypothetical protein